MYNESAYEVIEQFVLRISVRDITRECIYVKVVHRFIETVQSIEK